MKNIKVHLKCVLSQKDYEIEKFKYAICNCMAFKNAFKELKLLHNYMKNKNNYNS